MNNISIKQKQNINNSIANDLTKHNIINNNGNVVNAKKDCWYKTYITNNYKPQVAYVENNLYKKQDSRISHNTNNMCKRTNQYSTDAFNSYRINTAHNVKKTYYNSNNDVFINLHNTINANDTYNLTKNIITLIQVILLI